MEFLKKKTGNSWFWLALSLVICLIASLGASAVQSGGGSIEITPLRLQTGNGQIELLLYRPLTATIDNPAPAVVVCSGMQDNLQKQADFAVELARRGCVVVGMDQVSHGNSGTFDSFYWVENGAGRYFNVQTQQFVNNRDDATRFNAHGMIDVVEYIWNHMSFVDRDRIGVTGHSQGGVNATRTMRYYTNMERTGLGVNKISAMFSQSCNEPVYEGEMDGVDVAYVVGYVDEIFMGSLAREIPNGITTMPDLLHYHAKELVLNNTMYNWRDIELPAGKLDEIMAVNYEPGDYVYADDGSIRVFHTNAGDHCVQHWYRPAVENVTAFFMASFGMDGALPATSQVWQLKETFNGIGLIGFFMFMAAISGVLLKTRFFSPLRADEAAFAESMPEKPKTSAEYALLIAGLLILGFLPGLLFNTIFSQSWIPSNTTFPMPTLNQFTQFAIAVGAIILVYMLIVHFAFNKKKGYTAKTYGLSLKGDGDTAKDVAVKALKTVLLGIIVVVATYAITFISVGIFNVDYRFFELGINTFTLQKIGFMPSYIVFWLLYSFALTLAVNSVFRKGFNEWIVMAVTAVVNAVGLGVMLIPYFASFYATGAPYDTPNRTSIYRTFPMIPLIIFVSFLCRALYKKTGNVYLSTVVNGLMVLIITLANVAATFYFVSA